MSDRVEHKSPEQLQKEQRSAKANLYRQWKEENNRVGQESGRHITRYPDWMEHNLKISEARKKREKEV